MVKCDIPRECRKCPYRLSCQEDIKKVLFDKWITTIHNAEEKRNRIFICDICGDKLSEKTGYSSTGVNIHWCNTHTKEQVKELLSEKLIEINCPKCNSKEINKSGSIITSGGYRAQRVQCKKCGHVWRLEKNG